MFLSVYFRVWATGCDGGKLTSFCGLPSDVHLQLYTQSQFLPRDAMLASARPPVTTRYCTKTYHANNAIAQRDSSFLMSKISGKFQWSYPNGIAKYRCGRLKSSVVQPVYLAMSQKRNKIWSGYYGRLTRVRSIEWYHFEWPWVTHNYSKPPYFLYFASPFLSS